MSPESGIARLADIIRDRLHARRADVLRLEQTLANYKSDKALMEFVKGSSRYRP